MTGILERFKPLVSGLAIAGCIALVGFGVSYLIKVQQDEDERRIEEQFKAERQQAESQERRLQDITDLQQRTAAGSPAAGSSNVPAKQ